ncbi:MAG TPA: hypothetical protein VGP68_01820 [Gemmataceae bacterium]|nr:hypothetical protein [Gemmataceae bacterium]
MSPWDATKALKISAIQWARPHPRRARAPAGRRRISSSKRRRLPSSALSRGASQAKGLSLLHAGAVLVLHPELDGINPFPCVPGRDRLSVDQIWGMTMRRREFIAGLGGAAWPWWGAQQAPMPVVGFVSRQVPGGN